MFKPFAHVVVSTCVLIILALVFSTGAFVMHTTLQVVGFSLLITTFAWFIYMAVAIAICLPLKLNPGVLLQTVFGVISGSISIWLVSYIYPEFVLFANPLYAAPYAFVNTLFVWALGWRTGSLSPELRFWPTPAKKAQ
jgi:hypothetical protein